LAAKAWDIMQEIEAKGGIVASLQAGHLQALVATARAARQKLIATRRETITGVTDYPLLDATIPDFIARKDATQAKVALAPIRWAQPFEALRDRTEAITPRPCVFFANLGPLTTFGPRAQFARNLLGAGGVGALGEEDEYASRDAMIDAFRSTKAPVAIICGADAAYADDAENAAQRLKAAGADWLALAGKPGERETALRAAGVDQFVFMGVDALRELEIIQTALGIDG
jgi:methylmalonyl-CoA mutase